MTRQQDLWHLLTLDALPGQEVLHYMRYFSTQSEIF